MRRRRGSERRHGDRPCRCHGAAAGGSAPAPTCAEPPGGRGAGTKRSPCSTQGALGRVTPHGRTSRPRPVPASRRAGRLRGADRPRPPGRPPGRPPAAPPGRPLQILKDHSQVTLKPSLLQAEQSQFSQPFLQESCSTPLIILVASSGPVPRGPCPSCAGTPELDARLQLGLTRAEQRG
ncbi:translation initiation factor IF-2-like [Vidua macroura]|uniref:translation initiation factor IF-2-like n=1 Tax=Vidua macroura TaxID=187451 RepID=UPI0023A84D3C|nr:translation initiation factor IF-2-like [Vidua macroura]